MLNSVKTVSREDIFSPFIILLFEIDLRHQILLERPDDNCQLDSR